MVQDTDRELLPLMECFTSLAQALGNFCGNSHLDVTTEVLGSLFPFCSELCIYAG